MCEEKRNEKGWTIVPPKKYNSHSGGEQSEFSSRPKNYDYQYSNTRHNDIHTLKPINHFWNGFDECGIEKWYIEMDNGNLISSKNSEYIYIVKKFFPNDICRV
jgi:hypothetical protein